MYTEWGTNSQREQLQWEVCDGPERAIEQEAVDTI